MADRTTEARNGGSRTEAPTEEAGAAAPEEVKPASAGKAWLPLLVTVICMPLLAYATTRFVLLPQMKKALTQAAGAPAPETTPADTKAGGDSQAVLLDGKVRVTVPMSKILVNVAGTMGTRYLMTSVTLVGTDPNLKDKVDQNRDQLMDLATGTLCTKTIADLEKPGSRNVIRAELMTIFNNALGGPMIKEIYITELAIQ
jgi:flagellar protein FliL